MSLRFSALLLLTALCSLPVILPADVIYSNFGTDDAYSTGAGMIVTNDGMAWSSVAIEFIPANNYDLGSIEFVASDIMAGDPGISIGIFADNNGEPGGAPLESFSVAGPLGAFGSIVPVTTVTSVSQTLLLADTPYWVGMQGPVDDGLVVWNQNATGAEGFSSTDGNGNWSASPVDQGVVEIDGTIDNNVPPPPPPPSTPPALSVINPNAQSIPAVPEPATLWLMAGALITMLALRRRETKTP